MPMPREEADSAAAEAENLAEKTMTMSSADLKSALEAGSGVLEAQEPVEKAEQIPQEEAKPAEEADTPAVEAARTVEKPVSTAPEKIVSEVDRDRDSDSEDQPQGRLLPWEPDAPTDSSESSDKELSDR